MLLRVTCALIVLGTCRLAYAQSELVIEPLKDNTLYEHDEGSVSNGAGQYLFAGVTNASAVRRAVIAFDVSGVPQGATIDSVSLTMHLSRSIVAGPQTLMVHRLTSDWGEGSSDAGAEEGTGTVATANDATWLFAFYDTQPWQQPGGEFEAEASAALEVDGVGDYTWGGTQLTSDVQMWIENPNTNFGWIVLGDESRSGTAKRFDSRENPTEANRPELRIYYAESTAAEDEAPRRGHMLGENYPDPVRGTTTIPFELGVPGPVRIQIYDVLGRSRDVVVDQTLPQGTYSRVLSTAGFPNGTYLYCIQSDAGRECRTMVVAR